MIRFRRILCPVDLSSGSLRAFDYALKLAANYHSQVIAMHAVHLMLQGAYGTPTIAGDATAGMEREARLQLAALKAQGDAAGIPVDIKIAIGDVDTEIIRAVEEYKADLVVMGSHGRRGFEWLVLGSATERTIRHCPVPLLVVNSAPGTTRRAIPPRIPRILVTTDFSAGTRDALACAFSIAQECQSHITLFHTTPGAPSDGDGTLSQTLLAAVRQKLEALIPPSIRNGCHVETRISTGEAYPEILRFAGRWKPGLLIMNIHGKSLVERALIGSTAERVLRCVGAICPVLLIPPKHRKTAKAVLPALERGIRR